MENKRPIRVFVAGPCRETDKAAQEVFDAGFFPLFDDGTGDPFDVWVPVCDALLRTPGESDTADKQVVLADKLGIPVYLSIEVLIASPPYLGHPDFMRALDELRSLHRKKGKDYGTDQDPFANIRASSEWGISPWLGALIRANDKVSRLKTFAQTGKLANEGAEDSMLDLAAYALIALVLFREEQDRKLGDG